MNFFVGCKHVHLAVRPTKCLFGSKSVEYVDNLVDGDCITINEENLEKIRQATRPITKKEIRSFLRLANYYHDHIPSFAAIASPLSDLTRKGLPERVQWDDKQGKAFLALRENLLCRPVMWLPDHAKQVFFCTDASNCGLGAALMQKHDGRHYLVAYFSKKLTSTERRYSTLEKECLAIVWGVQISTVLGRQAVYSTN